MTRHPLILNQPTISGDGISMSPLSSDAPHLTLNTAGLVTAYIRRGHSGSTLDLTQ